MTSVTLNGFLNKKEIEASYGRSYRSLTRDITRAVKAGDENILRHLKLVTDDDTIREGSDVTLQMIQDLSNNGLRPMWLAEESWVAEWCARRSTHRPDDATSTQPGARPESTAPSASVDSLAATTPTHSAAAQFLQQRINDLAQQNELLRGQLQIKDDQIRTANQLAEQSQQLMRDLHVLLKNVQDGLLGEGSRPLITLGAPPSKPSDKSQRTESLPPHIESPKTRTPRRPTKSSARKAKTIRKPSTTAKPDTAPPPPDRLHRWFPTFLGSNQRRK